MLSTTSFRLPAYIDSSMLTTFRQCPRKFFWEYILCLRPGGRKVDLVAGGAFAAALETTYVSYFAHGLSFPKALAEGYRAFAHSWGDFPDEENHAGSTAKTFARTFQAVIDYFEVYPIEKDHIRPMMRQDGKPTFEFSFAIPLVDEMFPRHPDSGDPFLYAGRFDAFGHYDGRMVIRDEKTSGKAPSRFWSEQWNFRNQFLGYCWASQVSGYPVNTVVVRGITIQKTQFQHAEAIKIYPQFVIDRFVDQLARDLHRLVDCYRSDYFDYNIGDACNSFGRPCAFMDLCTAERPEAYFGDYTRERWNPLDRTSTPIEEAA